MASIPRCAWCSSVKKRLHPVIVTYKDVVLLGHTCTLCYGEQITHQWLDKYPEDMYCTKLPSVEALPEYIQERMAPVKLSKPWVFIPNVGIKTGPCDIILARANP